MPPAQTKKGIYPMEKEITVQELIDQLNKIENKNLPVDAVLLDHGVIALKKGHHIGFQKLVLNKSFPNENVVSVSLGLNGTWRNFEQVFDYPSAADSKDPETITRIEQMTKIFHGDREKAIKHMDSTVHEALKYAHENRDVDCDDTEDDEMED